MMCLGISETLRPAPSGPAAPGDDPAGPETRPAWFERSHWLLAAALLCVALGTAAWPARAADMVPLSIAELTAHADLVVRGRVESLTCQRDSAGRLRTEVHLTVREFWKGHASPGPFVVVLAGGTLGNERSVAVGQATYSPGEDVVVFLKRNARGEGVTLGLAQGKFLVETDARTGSQTVHNLFHGSEALPAAPIRAAAAGVGSSLSLAELRRQVLACSPHHLGTSRAGVCK